MTMQHLDDATLDDLVTRARASARRRLNLNLHDSMQASVHRLAIAMEPDSYVRPHRHAQRWELLLGLRGRFDVLVFSDDGTLRERHRLAGAANAGVPTATALASEGTATRVIEYPPNTWHTLVALDSGSVFFEVKEGPMVPPGPDDWMPSAPAEGDACVPAVLQRLRELQVGQRL